MKNGLTALLVMFSLLWTASGMAAEGEEQAPRRASSQINFGEAFKIEGKIRKPNVTFFISRQRPKTDEALELKASFTPRIVESVESAPF